MENEVNAKISEVSQLLYKIDDRGDEIASLYSKDGFKGILSNYSEFLLINAKDAVRSIESMIYIGDEEQEFNHQEKIEESEKYKYSIVGSKLERLDRDSKVNTEYSVFDLDLTQIGAKACLLPDGDVMIVGNVNIPQCSGISIREVWDTIRFNTKTLTCTKVGNLNHPRGFVGLCCNDNILYAFGGKRVTPTVPQLGSTYPGSFVQQPRAAKYGPQPQIPFGQQPQAAIFGGQFKTAPFENQPLDAKLVAQPLSSSSFGQSLASHQSDNSSLEDTIMKESEMMSLNTTSWVNLPNMTIAKFNCECFCWNGKIIIVGYHTSDLGDLEYYDIVMKRYFNFNLRFVIKGSITYRPCDEILYIIHKNNQVPTDLIVLSDKSDSSLGTYLVFEFMSKVTPNKIVGFTYQSLNRTRRVWLSLSEEALTFHDLKDNYQGIQKSIKMLY